MIQINYRDDRPIYEQVRDGLRRLVITGVIAQGDKIPSVRELASSLAINPNTIQRAYRELEAEGFICTVPGKGSFASDLSGGSASISAANSERTEKLLGIITESLRELMFIGMTEDDIAAEVKRRLGSDKRGEKV